MRSFEPMKNMLIKNALLIVVFYLMPLNALGIKIDPGNKGKDTIICKEDEITLGGKPTASEGLEPYKFEWKSDKGGFSSSDANPKAKPTENTTYTVKVTDADNFECEATIKVIVCEPEKIKLGIKKTMASKSCFKVYVPTRWGGKLKITTTNGTITKLKYPDKSDYSNGSETGTDKQGWYTFGVFDADNYEVKAEFIQTGQASKRPWNFYWWSLIPGTTTLYSIPGPLSKYDAKFGTTARSWEETNHGGTVGWFGHCLGASYASILLNQPTAISGFSATNDEMEGLWAELGEKDGIEICPDEVFGIPAGPPTSGSDATDAYAGKFHRIMEQYVKGLGKVLQSNLREDVPNTDGPDAVWNHGVWKYEAKYEEASGDNEKVVKIAITVYANGDHTPPTDDVIDRVISYVYIIEYSGGVVNESSGSQDWISVGGAAKYTPKWLSYITGVHWGGKNPFVTESKVRQVDNANH